MQKTPEKSTDLRHGMVISYFGSTVAVVNEDGSVIACHLRRNQELPVVGDRVEWLPQADGSGVIAAIMPRRSLLAKGDGREGLKPIAANVDRLIIMMAPMPVFSEYLIDRYLLAAELLSIQPVIVLNKIDLLDEASRKAIKERIRIYAAIPYPIAFTSVYSHQGLDDLSQLLANQSSVLVGPSGVGKSSMIAALSGRAEIRIGDVSVKGAGKHTTTATRLYSLSQGGCLIDSPGVREFHLWPVNKKDILRGFKEFQAVAGQCQFRDCQHLAEPVCAVQAAVKDGKISAERLKSYQMLLMNAK